jgi:hypothetical protein
LAAALEPVIMPLVTFLAVPQTAPRPISLLGNSVAGTGLVAAGLVTAYLTAYTPMVQALVRAGGAESIVTMGLGVWSFSMIAGGALLVSGTSRLAAIVAVLRTGGLGLQTRGVAGRALAGSNEETVVAGAVIRVDGTRIPELVVGAFGAAVIHELPRGGRTRQTRNGWELRTDNGWRPTDDPLETVSRDAERVRRWLQLEDLDFVVRVYGALVSDQPLVRSATCAVIRPDQIQGWLAALPRQRTLTAGRRARLIAMATPSRSTPAQRNW